MNTTRSRPRLSVASDGWGVVGHAGTRLLADLAEATSLERAFGEALASSRQRPGGHDPGRVAVDVAVMLADRDETISDLAVLGASCRREDCQLGSGSYPSAEC